MKCLGAHLISPMALLLLFQGCQVEVETGLPLHYVIEGEGVVMLCYIMTPVLN